MGFPIPRKRSHWIALAVLAPVLTTLVLNQRSFPWSLLNCWHQDVDITSGRVRHTHYLLYGRISDRTEETWLSRAHNGPQVAPHWRRVNTFSPGTGHSPHYKFHGAIDQIQTLEMADDVIALDPEARQKVARIVLKQWQEGGSDKSADDFVAKVADTAFKLVERGATGFRAADVEVP